MARRSKQPIAVAAEHTELMEILDYLLHHSTFYYDDPLGSFTAHCEKRQRGGCYWIAYRRRAGVLHRIHLGKSDGLTRQRLDEGVALLNSKQG
jgi:hypothetical protein